MTVLQRCHLGSELDGGACPRAAPLAGSAADDPRSTCRSGLLGHDIAVMWFAPFIWMVSTSLKYPADVMTQSIEWLPQPDHLRQLCQGLRVPGRALGPQQPDPGDGRRRRSVGALRRDGGLCAGAPALSRPRRIVRPVPGLVDDPDGSVDHPDAARVHQARLGIQLQALILPTIGNVFSVYIFRQFFLSFPSEIEDAARVDGAGPFSLFFLIALPLARAPAIAAAVILFTLNWNNFLWPLLVTFDKSMKTLPVGIAAFTPVVGTHTQLEGYSVAMAGVTILSVPSLAAVLLAAALLHPRHFARKHQAVSAKARHMWLTASDAARSIFIEDAFEPASVGATFETIDPSTEDRAG